MVSYQKAHLAIQLAFSLDQRPRKIMGVYWLLLNVCFQFNCLNIKILLHCRLLVNGLIWLEVVYLITWVIGCPNEFHGSRLYLQWKSYDCLSAGCFFFFLLQCVNFDHRFSPLSSKLGASPHGILSGSSPPVGSLPKPFPPFQHPSHQLLEENGFRQQK